MNDTGGDVRLQNDRHDRKIDVVPIGDIIFPPELQVCEVRTRSQYGGEAPLSKYRCSVLEQQTEERKTRTKAAKGVTVDHGRVFLGPIGSAIAVSACYLDMAARKTADISLWLSYMHKRAAS